MNLTTIPKYYNAITSFLSALVTFLTVLQTDQAITGSVPPAWAYGLGVGVSFLTGVLSHLRQLKPAADSAGDVSAVLNDLTKILDAYKNPVQTSITVATDPPVTKPPTPVSVIKDVESLPGIVTGVTGQASNVLDEISKVIKTYQAKI